MTSVKTKPLTCSKCRDTKFVLVNKSGRVHAEICKCFDCEKCGGEGRIFSQNEAGLSFLKDCDCLVLKKRMKLLDEAGIPGKFVHADFENYETAHGIHNSLNIAKTRSLNFIKAFRGYEKKFLRGLVFVGGPGLGKTHLAVSIIKTLILEDGIDCKFVDFFQLLGEIRHGYSEDLSEQALIQPYIQSRVLVIDELGKGRNNEWERTVLDQFISGRYNAADKITIFTSNFSNKETDKKKYSRNETSGYVDPAEPSYSNSFRDTLQDKIGDRIVSRLVEMCEFEVLTGADFRHKASRQGQP